ncbi:hypothetical protein OQA88_2134 [Cercophora sp. LCS_1]
MTRNKNTQPDSVVLPDTKGNTSPVATFGNDGGVLCLGAFRTGTYSMTTALNILGIDRVLHGRHMATWAKENPLVLQQWARAAWANLPYMRVLYPDPARPPGWLRPEFASDTASFTRQDWDALLGGFQGIADVACLYPESLVKAYPRAKVILCYRDPDKWAASMDDTLVQTVAGWPGMLVRRLAEPLTGTFGFTMRWDVLRAWFEVGTVQEMRAGQVYRNKFEAHYAAVRAMVPPEQLLEYHLGDGWGPLCEFLGVPEPAVSFPRVNDGPTLRRTLKRGMAVTLLKALWILLKFPVLLVGLWLLIRNLKTIL